MVFSNNSLNQDSSNDQPILSIIIPAYNAERYLSSCIPSILQQAFVDFEVIVVNDGSTDGTGNVLEKFMLSDSRIRVINQENSGVSAARNRGLEEARGEWIYFCDADDELLPNAFLKFDELRHCGADCLSFGYVIDGEVKSIVDKEILIKSQEAKKLLFHPPQNIYQGYLWSKMFRASVIRNNSIRFDASIKYNEDRLFIYEYLSAMSGEVLLSPVPIYKYSVNESGAMGSIRNGRYADFRSDLIAFKEMYFQEARNGQSPILDEIFYQIVCSYYKNRALINKYSHSPKEEISRLRGFIDFVPASKRHEYWLYIKFNAAVNKLKRIAGIK